MSGFIRAGYYYESEAQVISNVPADIASRKVSMVNASIGLSTLQGSNQDGLSIEGPFSLRVIRSFT